jgi:hypothetical protein
MTEDLEQKSEESPEKKTRKFEPVKIAPAREYSGRREHLQFDPDLSPYHSHNRRVAKSRGWRFTGEFYVDKNSYVVADAEGNPLFHR